MYHKSLSFFKKVLAMEGNKIRLVAVSTIKKGHLTDLLKGTKQALARYAMEYARDTASDKITISPPIGSKTFGPKI